MHCTLRHYRVMPSVGTDNSSIFDLGNSLFVFLLSCCSVLEEDSKYLLLRLEYLFFHMRLPSRQFYCIIIIGYLMLKYRRLVAVRTTLSYRYTAKKALHWRVCSSWPSADKRRRLLLTAIACNCCISNVVQHAHAYASEMQDIGIQRTCAGMKLAKLHKTNALHMLGSTKCALVLYCVLRYQQVRQIHQPSSLPLRLQSNAVTVRRKHVVIHSSFFTI